MNIKRKNFLVQVKYSDLAADRRRVEKYFLGFGGELYLDADEITSYDSRIIEDVKRLSVNKRLTLRLHVPIFAFDYSNMHDTMSRAIPIYNNVIRFCETLKIDAVAAHADLDRYPHALTQKARLESAGILWRTLCAEFNLRKIHVNIENHSEDKPDDLILLMKMVHNASLGMCVDIGHIHAFSDLPMGVWLDRYPMGSIKEVHLADNAGDGDTHLALGEGTIDFTEFFTIFNMRHEECIFVLEPRNIREGRKSIAFLEKEGFIE